MIKEDYNITDWKRLRSRIEHEDNLLNSRVNLFLVVNGLGAVAIGQTLSKPADIVMISVILFANLLWIIGCSQSVAVLKNLTTVYINGAEDQIDDIVRDSMHIWPRGMRNTSIFGRYLPFIVTIGWCIGLCMVIFYSK